MKTTATDFRSHLYEYLDRVLATGEALEIERKGRMIVVQVENKPSLLDRLKPRDTLVGDPEKIIHTDWSTEWNPGGGFTPVS